MKKKVFGIILIMSLVLTGSITMANYEMPTMEGGKTCNGNTNCPNGKSASRNSSGGITGCCTNATPDMTGHYHS